MCAHLWYAVVAAVCAAVASGEEAKEYILTCNEAMVPREADPFEYELREMGVFVSRFVVGGHQLPQEPGTVIAGFPPRTRRRFVLVTRATPQELDEILITFWEFIENVEVNGIVEGSSLSCPDTAKTVGWHQKRTVGSSLLRDSWTHNSSWGTGTTVYTADSGVNCNHAEFEDRCVNGANFVDEEPNEDLSGHGTKIASVAVGKNIGMAPAAQVVAAKCLNATNAGNVAACVQALQSLADHAEVGPHSDVRVLVLAFAAKVRSPVLELAIQNLVDLRFFVVVAAGNTGSDACEVYPALPSSVVTVGASSLNPYEPEGKQQVTPWSNWGPCVDLFAPGEDVFAASHTEGYTTGTGTSMSAPVVAGVLLAYTSTNPNVTPEEAKAWLLANAKHCSLTGLQPGSPDLLVYLPCES